MNKLTISCKKTFILVISLLLVCLGAYAQPSYCTSGLGGTVGDLDIVNVTVPGTTLNNTTIGAFTYSAFPITGSTTAVLQQGGTYTIMVRDSIGTGNIGMWIDFNQDGVFETYEWFSVGTNIAGTASATFTVPAYAHTGVTGLRIRTRDEFDGSVLAGDACVDYFSGETQDYYVTIDTTLPCAGTPTTGVIAGPAANCPGNSFTLYLSGYTITSGLTYQWLSHPVGSGSFTAIAGATNSTYSTAITSATDYELAIRCTASGLTSTSATFTETLTPSYMCYCNDSLTLGGESFYAPIDSVSIVGTTLNNYTPGNPRIYTAFPASGSTTAALQQGGTYTIVINSNDGFDPANTSVWIDYNHNGTYDAVEWNAVGSNILGNAVASFTVPFTASTGLTGLRVRSVATGFGIAIGSGDACTMFGSGETEDYIISIDTTYPCAGTPSAGIVSGPDSVCPSHPFTLWAYGYTIASGLDYQWLSSPAVGGTYTAIAGATNLNYIVPSQVEATDYKLQVYCVSSGMIATSAVYQVDELPFYRCYCDSATLGGSSSYVPIDSVAVLGTTLNNPTPFNPFAYSSYPASGSTTATLAQGEYYNIVVNASDGFDPANIAMWVDYNHSGTFDPIEFKLLGTDVLGNTLAEYYIPLTALTGNTGLRIRSIAPGVSGETLSSGDACTPYITGETEDYTIAIDTTYPCTGTPTAGTITGPDSICLSSPLALTLTGYSTTAGITFQWQSRPSGSGSFTAISGATTPFYYPSGITTATDYNVVVTCPSSGLMATSAIFTVGVRSFYTCYCNPTTGIPLVSFGGENEITEAKLSGTSFNATGMTVPASLGYAQVPPSPASNTATLYIGSAYSYTITIDSATYFPTSLGAWIDYNHNGIYDASEFTTLSQLVSGYDGTYTGTFSVPSSSITGPTGMRIAASDYIFVASTTACGNFEIGEALDFVVDIEHSTSVPLIGNSTFIVKAFPNPANKFIPDFAVE